MDTATRGSFSDYLKAIAMGATWYLEHVYIPTGYSAQPKPVEDWVTLTRSIPENVEPIDPWDQAVDA